LRELAIAQLIFEPENLLGERYHEPFEYLKRATVTHALFTGPKTFMVLSEVEWKYEPDVELLKRWEILSKESGWFLFRDITELSRDGKMCIYMSYGEHMPNFVDIMEMMYSEFFCFFEFPHVYEESEVRFQVVGERKNIKRFVDMLSDMGVEVRIGNIQQYHVKGRALLSELTQRQYDCMKLAVESGYFEIPKKADLRKLAKKKKITHGAFSFHLRKAQRTINKALFG
jgi:hypothetical protein